MPFVKLDKDILDSTLWLDRDTRDVFITTLLMAEPFELLKATPQLQIRSFDTTGWIVPAGWYGFVASSAIPIGRKAGLSDNELINNVFEGLGSPELSSKSRDFDGRRCARVDGGYIVLNFMKYRDKDHGSAARSKRYRKRQKDIAAAKKRAAHNGGLQVKMGERFDDDQDDT